MVPIHFDVATNGVGNDISGLQLVAPGGEPLLMLGNNLTATNGRVTGTALTNSVFAQQLLENPCGLTLTLSTPSGTAISGSLAIGKEVFIPVAGSTLGLLGNRWKTDLNIFNIGTNGSGVSALVQFIPTGARSPRRRAHRRSPAVARHGGDEGRHQRHVPGHQRHRRDAHHQRRLDLRQRAGLRRPDRERQGDAPGSRCRA